MKRKYVSWNIAASFASQASGILISLFIPRLIIANYGSDVNGVVSTLARIASYSAIVQAGVVAAAGANLFRAFEKRNHGAVSSIFAAAHQFFLRTGGFLALAAIAFSFLFPIGQWGTTFYTTAVGVSLLSFVVVILGYVVFFKYNLIVDSDQRSYIIINSLIITNVTAAIIQALLITCGASIIGVAAVPPCLGILRLLITRSWVLKKYPYLNVHDKPNHRALDQKWDSLAISTSRLLKFVLPSFLASLFLGFDASSIFLIYATVFNIGSSIVEMLGTTLAPSLGRVLAKGDSVRTRKDYELATTVSVLGSGMVSACFIILFPSFLALYLDPVADISYWRPALMWLFIFNEFVNNIRLASNLLVRASGHLRQTRGSALVELLLAGIATPLGALAFGLDGIMIGILISSLYRTVFLEVYCRNTFQIDSWRSYVARLIGAVCVCLVLVLACSLLPIEVSSFADWTLLAVVAVGIGILVTLLSAIILDRQSCARLWNVVRRRSS